MAAENAAQVAKEVIEAVGKGLKPEKTKSAERNGYSPKSARAGKATRTKAYKETIRPFLEQMEKERLRLMAAIRKANLSKERYKDMVDSLDKLTKNIQLLSGGKTSNDNFTFTWQNAPSSNPVQPEKMGEPST